MSTTKQEEQSIPNTETHSEPSTETEERSSVKESEGLTENEENLPALPSDVDGFKLMDALDDEIIQAELENRIVEHWVYAFKQDGKMVSNLSKAGVDACCTEMAKKGHIIEESQVDYRQDPTSEEHILFVCTATRYVINNDGTRVRMETVNGAKRQHTKMYTKSKGFVSDPFWFEKGAMKAARNARNRLIPEEIRVQILALAKDKNRVRKVTGKDAEKVTEQPKAETPSATNNEPDYAKGKDKSFIEAWIGENLGKGEVHRKLFKYWAASFATPMVGKNAEGVYTLNKVDMRLVKRIRTAPADAGASFSEWYDRYLLDNAIEGPEDVLAILEGEVIPKKDVPKGTRVA